MKYNYKFATGTETVEIDEKWAEVLKDLDKVEYNSARKISTNCLFFDSDNEYSNWGAEEDSEIESFIDGETEEERLQKAINKLKPSQKEIIFAIYFQGLKQTEYAEKLGVNQSNISRRLQTAEKNLKKFLQKTA